MALGTNAFLADTDGNGFSAFEEVSWDGDPDDYDPLVDTNPLDPDADGDGLGDAGDPEPLVPALDVRATPTLSTWASSLLIVGLAISALSRIDRRRSAA